MLICTQHTFARKSEFDLGDVVFICQLLKNIEYEYQYDCRAKSRAMHVNLPNQIIRLYQNNFSIYPQRHQLENKIVFLIFYQSK